MTILNKKAHRGTDIGPLGTTINLVGTTINFGTEYPSDAVAGRTFYRTDLSSVFIYDGKTWSEIPRGSSSVTTSAPTPVESIASWAADKLPNDNDVIYIRRKNDRLFWTEGNKIGGTSWREINGTGVLPTGLKQEIVEIGEAAPPVDEVIKTYIPSGWYQDISANLFKHEGAGVWVDASNTLAKKLTKSAEAGEMEYLG